MKNAFVSRPLPTASGGVVAGHGGRDASERMSAVARDRRTNSQTVAMPA